MCVLHRRTRSNAARCKPHMCTQTHMHMHMRARRQQSTAAEQPQQQQQKGGGRKKGGKQQQPDKAQATSTAEEIRALRIQKVSHGGAWNPSSQWKRWCWLVLQMTVI